MKRIVIIGVLSIVIILAVALPVNAAPASTYTSNEIVQYTMTVWVPCANDGLGEYVDFSGEFHSLYHYAINGNSFTFKGHGNAQGITGVGQITGDKYQATGVSQYTETGSFVNGQHSWTDVYNFQVVGQGKGNNYLVHQTQHYTINANGELTVSFDNLSVDCK
jgi:hypothetical protein